MFLKSKMVPNYSFTGSVLVFYQCVGVVGQSTHSKQQNYHQFDAFMNYDFWAFQIGNLLKNMKRLPRGNLFSLLLSRWNFELLGSPLMIDAKKYPTVYFLPN